MQHRVVDGANNTATLILNGKLDILGAGQIELPLATLAGAKKAVTVDLTAVDFIASIGIRHFVSAARSLMRRGGKLLLLKPAPMVAEVLRTSGATELMQIVQSEDEVAAALG